MLCMDVVLFVLFDTEDIEDTEDGEGIEEVCSDVNRPKRTSKLRTTGALAITLNVGTSLAILHVRPLLV